MTTDNNQDRDGSINEAPNKLNTPTLANISSIPGSSTMSATRKAFSDQNFNEAVMPSTHSSRSVALETNNVVNTAPLFDRLQTGQGLPISTASPSICTTPPSMSSSASSAFKIVPQRQKHLHDNNEGKLGRLYIYIYIYIYIQRYLFRFYSK